MSVLKIILIIIDIIISLALIIVVMSQKNDDKGMSGTITGAAASNYLDKNKGRTKEGKLKRMTIVLGIAFVVVTILLNMVYPLGK